MTNGGLPAQPYMLSRRVGVRIEWAGVFKAGHFYREYPAHSTPALSQAAASEASVRYPDLDLGLVSSRDPLAEHHPAPEASWAQAPEVFPGSALARDDGHAPAVDALVDDQSAQYSSLTS
ncbi:hypothetical protein SAMN05216198_1511 [Halopseudomonas litoralis]|uniref:Uncharacterized protein n=1 Tax=Halopseudomonas litoralis TaxID=797277 RepID=A0A1H1QKV2_9GAMM|nr:hypothetical protein SAMN05216198_1511 [Halopseudomonas litoralis]